MKAAARLGLDLLQNEKPHSSVTAYIDMLCQDRFLEDDYEGIPELVESINLQSTGPTEASRAIRKKLKYSNVHGQLRSLTILKALVENCGQNFQSTFANERLVDRIKLMMGDPSLDTKVRRKILSVLNSWYREFKDDRRMELVAGLYHACGGGKKTISKTAATEAYENQQARYEREATDRTERKMKERLNKEKERDRLEKEKADKKNKNKPKVKRIPFNFEAEKSKIMATVGHATQSSQNLINALQHVNREKESVTTNERVVDCLAKAKADRKIIVRYIQQVENDTDGDYIGTLLSTNEQVLNALALYDRYSKPFDLDSDDEQISSLQAFRAPPSSSTSNNNNNNQQYSNNKSLNVPVDNDDTFSIRSRLSAFDIRDSEMDKLHASQRDRVDRENRSRANRGHPDLQDLAFGPTPGSSSLPPPIQPTSNDHYSHGSLAEYSDGTDYSSSEGEEVSHPPPTSFSSSTVSQGISARPGEDAKSYAQFIHQSDDTRAGKGLLEEDDEGDDDPFADPEGGNGGEEVDYRYDVTPGVHQEGKRMDWRQV